MSHGCREASNRKVARGAGSALGWWRGSRYVGAEKTHLFDKVQQLWGEFSFVFAFYASAEVPFEALRSASGPLLTMFAVALFLRFMRPAGVPFEALRKASGPLLTMFAVGL